MKLYKKFVVYSFIAGASIIFPGCTREEESNTTHIPEQEIIEESKYTFEKSVFEDKLNVVYSGIGSSPLSVTCGDLDGDGDLEVIVATVDGLTIYENKTEQKE
jgi:hypothetical protein